MSANDDMLIVPPELQEQVKAAAAAERRAPGQLVSEALERYLWERRWLRDGDIHAKIAQGLASLEQGHGLDGESVMAQLIAELDEADHFGPK